MAIPRFLIFKQADVWVIIDRITNCSYAESTFENACRLTKSVLVEERIEYDSVDEIEEEEDNGLPDGPGYWGMDSTDVY